MALGRVGDVEAGPPLDEVEVRVRRPFWGVEGHADLGQEFSGRLAELRVELRVPEHRDQVALDTEIEGSDGDGPFLRTGDSTHVCASPRVRQGGAATQATQP